MAKAEKKTKKKCCKKFLQKGNHCSKCPIVDNRLTQEKVAAEKKKRKKKKAKKNKEKKE